jgi:hypothetical protein
MLGCLDIGFPPLVGGAAQEMPLPARRPAALLRQTVALPRIHEFAECSMHRGRFLAHCQGECGVMPAEAGDSVAVEPLAHLVRVALAFAPVVDQRLVWQVTVWKAGPNDAAQGVGWYSPDIAFLPGRAV